MTRLFKNASFFYFITLFVAYSFAESQIIIDEDFEKGYKNWNVHKTEGSFKVISTDSGKVLKITRRSINGDNSTMLIHPLPRDLVAGKHIYVEVKVKAEDIEAGNESYHGGHIDFEIRTAKSTQYKASDIFLGPFDWEKMTLEFDMPEDAKMINFRIGLQGAKGTVYFDDVKVHIIE